MTPISLSSITYSQGLQLLAARKQALDSGHIPRMSKEAMANSFPLRDIGADYIEKIAESGLLDSLKSGFGGMDSSTRNVLLSGLAGAGLGAGTGAASALFNGEEGAGWKALKGGLAGGAIGGGLGLAFNPELLHKAFKLEKSPGLTSSALPANASNAQHRAAQIKSRTPAEQLDEINKLQGVADSSMPEVVNYTAHGLNTAAAGGAGAYIANKSVYDPATLTSRIHSDMASSKSAVPDILAQPAEFRVDSMGTRWHKDAVKAQKGKPATGIDMTKLWNQMTGTPLANLNPADEAAAHEIMRKYSPEQIMEKFKLKSSIPGRIPTTLNSRLSGAFTDDLAEKMLEKSKLPGMFTGAGKLRPGKAALLALLAGGWGLGAGAIRHNYRQSDTDRTDAKSVLNALRTTVLPEQTSNTMQ
jgi:hypothetical protein